MNLARLSKIGRFEAAAQFAGTTCDITYGQFEKTTETFQVIGPAEHLTNGNSTGDLIVQKPGFGWRRGEALITTASIALARIQNIEKVTE